MTVGIKEAVSVEASEGEKKLTLEERWAES